MKKRKLNRVFNLLDLRFKTTDGTKPLPPRRKARRS
jgi:hypothetical protein